MNENNIMLKLEKILVAEKIYDSKYFDELKYTITSFNKEKEHILYIWDMALFTSRMQKISNVPELNSIVESIKNTNHEFIKTISIDSIEPHKGKSITLLTDVDVNHLIGIYFPPKPTKWV